MACARLRYEGECACDDAVMSIGVTSHSYATELLDLARSSGPTWPAVASGPGDGRPPVQPGKESSCHAECQSRFAVPSRAPADGRQHSWCSR
jgi:hypothetical protein